VLSELIVFCFCGSEISVKPVELSRVFSADDPEYLESDEFKWVLVADFWQCHRLFYLTSLCSWWHITFSVPCGPGAIPLPSLFLHFPTFLLCLLVSFTFSFSFSYLFHLFSCFSIPFHSSRILARRFQAGCRRRQLNLDLVFLCWFYDYVFLIKNARSFLSYLI